MKLALAAVALIAAPATAQEFKAPRFEGLEQQQRTLEQQSLDSLQKDLQTERQNRLTPGATTPGASALRQLEIERQMNDVRLKGELDRAQVQRERAIDGAQLPNRRISRASVLVVQDPVRYGLPAAPPGQYYARLEGRFVLVDAMSELVVKVVEPTPSDPRGDLPAQPLPPPQPPVSP
jgi:Ni/Co efflux regulator RcnB